MTAYAIDEKFDWSEVWLCPAPDHFVRYVVLEDEWVKRSDGKYNRLIKRIQIAEPLLLPQNNQMNYAR